MFGIMKMYNIKVKIGYTSNNIVNIETETSYHQQKNNIFPFKGSFFQNTKYALYEMPEEKNRERME